MRILLTGVPGWLGNRFLEILVKGFQGEGAPNGWSLKCLVYQGADDTFIRELSKTKKIDCAIGDVTKPATLSGAFSSVDVVFHAAGIIHPAHIRQLYETNVLGTENVLKECVKEGVKRFIFLSSNSVAGIGSSSHPVFTENSRDKPYMHYGNSKYQAEQKVREHQRGGRLETVILRPCWYYGPHQPDRQTTFFRMIKKNHPLMFGDGNNLRSMSYVDNASQAMILAAENRKAAGQTYWIADAKPYTANEIYSTVASLLGVRNFRPLRLPGFVSDACAIADSMLQSLGQYLKEIHVAGEMNKNIACSIEKAQEELGYVPSIALEEGMRRSIEWCRARGIDL